MKTIELMIGGQKAQFTTKSLTFEGKEYFYSNMTNLQHSPIILTYSFDYDGETKRLTYQKKDAKILAVIFSQVQKMEAQKQAQAAEAEKEDIKVAETNAETIEEAKQAAPEEIAEAEPVSEETPAENKIIEEEAPAEEEKAPKKSPKERFAALSSSITSKHKKNKEETNEGEEVSEEKEPMDPEKKAKLKKALRNFGIILAAFIVAAVIYYAAFGTNGAPTDKSPNNIESQQYDDIDHLIDDLQ